MSSSFNIFINNFKSYFFIQTNNSKVNRSLEREAVWQSICIDCITARWYLYYRNAGPTKMKNSFDRNSIVCLIVALVKISFSIVVTH